MLCKLRQIGRMNGLPFVSAWLSVAVECFAAFGWLLLDIGNGGIPNNRAYSAPPPTRSRHRATELKAIDSGGHSVDDS